MIVNWDEIRSQSAEEIENLRVQLLKEVQTMKDNRHIIRQEYHNIKNQILLLEVKLHDLKTTLEKSAYTINQREVDIEILQSLFWEKKGC